MAINNSELKVKRDRKDCYLDSVDSSEVLQIFLADFNHAQQISENQQRFQTNDNKKILDVYFRKDGAIERIEDNLKKQDFKKLQEKIKNNLIDNNTERMAQVICFSSEKVAGSFRYRDLFQIISIPDYATPAPYAIADHPFILQFKYLATPNFTINSTRQSRYVNTYIKTLNAIIRTHIFGAPRYVRQFWSWEIVAPNQTKSKWVQQGYVIDKFPEVDDFSDGIDPIELKPAHEYYSQRLGRSLNNLVLPDNLTLLLDKVFALDAAKRKKFDIACTWFAQAQDIWLYSHSAAYIAIISAIESLMEKTKETCGSCGQPKFSVNKNFRTFLETYVPNINAYPKEKKLIYKIRSELAHGADLLLSDLQPWAFMPDSKKTNQDTLHRLTHEVVATALINWLISN